MSVSERVTVYWWTPSNWCISATAMFVTRSQGDTNVHRTQIHTHTHTCWTLLRPSTHRSDSHIYFQLEFICMHHKWNSRAQRKISVVWVLATRIAVRWMLCIGLMLYVPGNARCVDCLHVCNHIQLLANGTTVEASQQHSMHNFMCRPTPFQSVPEHLVLILSCRFDVHCTYRLWDANVIWYMAVRCWFSNMPEYMRNGILA